MKRRDVLAGLGGVALAGNVQAQGSSQGGGTWPERLVKIVVAFGPGGSTDIIARIVGKQLETVTGKPFVVENKPGATGMVGTTLVKNSPADSYTMLLGSTSTLAANPSLYKTMTYDPSDFTTVAVNGTTGNFIQWLVVNANIDPNTQLLFGNQDENSDGTLCIHMFVSVYYIQFL